MRQLEGGFLSNRALDRSEQRVRRLPFIEDVSKETDARRRQRRPRRHRVHVKEGLPGSFGGGVGYSGLQGVMLQRELRAHQFSSAPAIASRPTSTRAASAPSTGSPTRTPTSRPTACRARVRVVSRHHPVHLRRLRVRHQDRHPGAGVQLSDLGVHALRFGVQLMDSTPADQPVQPLPVVALGAAERRHRAHRHPGASRCSSRTSSPTNCCSAGSTIRATGCCSPTAARGTGFAQLHRARAATSSTTRALRLLQYFPFFGRPSSNGAPSSSYAEALGDTTEIPPFKRFFGGGPGTVRGFREGWMGPRDTNNNPFGGNLQGQLPARADHPAARRDRHHDAFQFVLRRR
jgi:outer membrane protein insertion porin family